MNKRLCLTNKFSYSCLNGCELFNIYSLVEEFSWMELELVYSRDGVVFNIELGLCGKWFVITEDKEFNFPIVLAIVYTT